MPGPSVQPAYEATFHSHLHVTAWHVWIRTPVMCKMTVVRWPTDGFRSTGEGRCDGKVPALGTRGLVPRD
jgi:hypothetical protein